MRLLILSLILSSVFVGTLAFGQTSDPKAVAIRLGVREYYDSLWVTLKERDRGEVYDFCMNYTGGGTVTPSSSDNDLSISCKVHDSFSILKVGIGFTNNVVHNVGEPIHLVEPISKLHDLSSSEPFNLIVDDKYGNHFSLKINSLEVSVGFKHE